MSCCPSLQQIQEAADAVTALVHLVEAHSSADDQNELESATNHCMQAVSLLLAYFDGSKSDEAKILSSILATCRSVGSWLASNDAAHLHYSDSERSPSEAANEDTPTAERLSEKEFEGVRAEDIAVSWNEIVGADEACAALQQAVVLPQRFPHLFQGPSRAPWKCILLYGPPGTGKTTLARAAAKEARATLFSLSAADLLSKWVGESEKAVRGLFETAAKCDRSVVLLDEIDALCSARGSDGESESARRVKTEFFVRIQEAVRLQSKVLIIAATNLPWELDSAFRRRFDKLVYVGLPTFEARCTLLTHQLAGIMESPLSATEIQELARRLDGYSGSDIKNIVRQAAMNPIWKLQQATHFTWNAAQQSFVPCDAHTKGAQEVTLMQLPPTQVKTPAVTKADIETACRSYPMSVSARTVQEYAKWARGDRSENLC